MGKRGTGQGNWVCVVRRLVATAGDEGFVDAGEECGKKQCLHTFFFIEIKPISKYIYIYIFPGIRPVTSCLLISENFHF